MINVTPTIVTDFFSYQSVDSLDFTAIYFNNALRFKSNKVHFRNFFFFSPFVNSFGRLRKMAQDVLNRIAGNPKYLENDRHDIVPDVTFPLQLLRVACCVWQ